MQEQEKKIKDILEALSAPFVRIVGNKTYPDHKWKPQDGKSDEKKIMCIAYLAGGQVRDRLNEVLGVDGWMSKSKLELDNTRNVTLSIKVGDGEWIDRDGLGVKGKEFKGNEESVKNALKAADTDGLKRAARNFGIGAYLEQLAPFWIDRKGKLPCDKNGKALYGNNLHNYINGFSTEQGMLAQIMIMNPKAWNIPEFKILWEKLK